jgi:hypothetical protein
MKYLSVQLIILLWSVIFLYYLTGNSFFLPIDAKGEINWYNVLVTLALLCFAIQSAVAILIYIIRKIAKRKDSNQKAATKWGIGLSVIFLLLVALNFTHLLSWQWGAVIAVIVILGIILIK